MRHYSEPKRCWEFGSLLILLITLLAPIDGEAQFTIPPVLVASPPSGQFIQDAKLFIGANGTIHIAWKQAVADPGPSSIMYARSLDGGQTFSIPVPIPAAARGGVALGALAVNSHGDIFITGTGTGDLAPSERIVFVRVSRDGGQSFPFVTTFGPGDGPSLAIDGADSVDLAWSVFDLGQRSITFSRSTDKGSTYSSPKTIFACGGAFIACETLAVSSKAEGTVYIAVNILVSLPPSHSTSFLRSTDGGVTFTPAQGVSIAGATQRLFVEASGVIDLLTQDVSRTNPQPLGTFVRSVDGGQTFSVPVQVPFTGGLFIADEAGNITVFGGLSNSVGVSRSVDHGESFGPAASLGLAVGVLDVQVDSGSSIYLLYRAGGSLQNLLLTKLTGLLPTLAAVPPLLETGELIRTQLRVDNLEGQPFTNVSPSPIVVQGFGGVSPLSGPIPPVATILPGGAQTFDFTFVASSPGTVTFTGGASGTRSTGEQLTTPSITSSPVLIQAAPALVVTTFRAGPTSVNVGGTINVNMTVINLGGGAANAVTTSVLTLSNPSLATLVISPGPQTIPGGGSTTFFWTFTAVSPGILDFTGTVTGTDALTGAEISSPIAISNSVGIGVSAPPSPVLLLTPIALSLNSPAGAIPPPQSLSLVNMGGGRLSWTSSATTNTGGSWLSISPAHGTAPSTGLISVTTSGLSPGPYNGSITITAPGADDSPQLVTVTLTIQALPALVITSLQVAPTTVSIGDTINVTMTVMNAGLAAVNAVTPSRLTLSDPTLAAGKVGPSPQTIAPAASVIFFWAYTAINPGTLDFVGSVSGNDALSGATISSLPGTSSSVNIQGQLSVNTAFVARLYSQVLDREPDLSGLQAFLSQIQQFGSVVPTVFAFFHSDEFLRRNTPDTQFLTILYQAFLNREPDSAGFNAFLTDLQSGILTRDTLIDIFLDSLEFANLASFLPPQDPVTAFVTTLYVRILGRGPDLPGLQAFVTQLQQSRTVLPTVLFFLHSPEFLARNTSNTEYVTVLYRVFLDRVPDAGGLASFVALLTNGTATRDQLAAQFAASPEFQAIQHQLFP